MGAKVWLKALVAGLLIVGVALSYQGLGAPGHAGAVDRLQSTQDQVRLHHAHATIQSGYGSRHDALQVGRAYGDGWTQRSLIRFGFDPNSVPTGDVKAKMLLWVRFFGPDALPAGRSYPTVAAHLVTSPWDASSVTWDSQPSFSATPVATAYVDNWSGYDPGGGRLINLEYYAWDITEAFGLWRTGQAPNYGLLLKLQDEQSHPTATFQVWFESSLDPLGSYNGAAPSPHRPFVQVVVQ